ncbi:MAG: hypothetical protein Q9214_007751, partial [Letrouitia sp. 1 TL-2023]
RSYRRKPTRGIQSTNPGKAKPTMAKTSKRKGMSSTTNSMDCQRRGSNRCLNGYQLPKKGQNKGHISQQIIKDESSEFSSEVNEFENEIASGYGSTAGQQVVFDLFSDADPLSINFGFFSNFCPPAYAQAQTSPLKVINIGNEERA